MNLVEMRAAILEDLGQVDLRHGIDETAQEAALDRAVVRAVTDISRLFPRIQRVEAVVDTEHTLTLTAQQTTLQSYITADDTVVTKTTNGTDENITDFTLNHLTGVLRISDDAWATGSGIIWSVSYKTLSVAINLAAVFSNIEDIITIRQVEYPAGEIPQRRPDFNWLDDYIIIKSTGGQNRQQEELTEGDLIWIYLNTVQTPPTESASGSYQRNLDRVVLKGAEYYLLYAKALKLFDDARAALSADIADLDSGNVDDIEAIIDAGSGTSLSNAASALSTIAQNITAATGIISSSGSNNMHTYVSSAISSLTTATTGVQAILGLVASTDLTDAVSYWAEQKKWLESAGGHANANAQTHLNSGAGLINTLTDGDRPEAYRADYARVAGETGRSYARNRELAIAQAQTRISQATAKLQESRNYLEAATARGNQAQLYSTLSVTRIEEAAGYVRIAQVKLEGLISLLELRIRNTELQSQRVSSRARVILETAQTLLQQALILRDEYFGDLQNKLPALRNEQVQPTA